MVLLLDILHTFRYNFSSNVSGRISCGIGAGGTIGDMAFRDDISRGSAEPGPSSAAQSAVNDDDRVLLWWAPITIVSFSCATNNNGRNEPER